MNAVLSRRLEGGPVCLSERVLTSPVEERFSSFGKPISGQVAHLLEKKQG